MSRRVEDIAGYEVLTLAVQPCVAEVMALIGADDLANVPGKGCWLACLNPHSYALALDDAQFSRALQAADWLIPDGAGIVLASRVLGGEIRHRVTGSDIFFGVLSELNRVGDASVFFLGSTEETLAEIGKRMARDYPNVIVSGRYSPPFKATYSQDELDEMVEAINTAAPDVLWVGMTAPKQEKWIAEMIGQLDVRFVAAIGAVFDFYAERVRRSHPIFQRLGLEWLPRLVQEPRRLWRRMFVSAPIFLWHVLLTRLGLDPGKSRSVKGDH